MSALYYRYKALVEKVFDGFDADKGIYNYYQARKRVTPLMRAVILISGLPTLKDFMRTDMNARDYRIQEIIQLLNKNPMELQDEKMLQGQVEKLFISKSISFLREHNLDKRNKPDFLVDDLCGGYIAVEIKIKGQKRDIYEQCKGYCEFDKVSAIVLATNFSMGFPEYLHEKPCYLVNLGLAWL